MEGEREDMQIQNTEVGKRERQRRVRKVQWMEGLREGWGILLYFIVLLMLCLYNAPYPSWYLLE